MGLKEKTAELDLEQVVMQRQKKDLQGIKKRMFSDPEKDKAKEAPAADVS
jgi:hypothetical protein